MNIHSLLSAQKQMMPYTDSFMKALALFPIKVSKYPPLKTPDSRRCITSDPISLLRFVLSSLYMMKAVPTGFLFHQPRIIWSFQLCKFSVQWNPLLSMLTWYNRSKLPLTTSAYLLCVSLVGQNLFITPTDFLI